MQKPGKWILVDETPAEMTNKGIPEVGDPIRIDYNEMANPDSGMAKRIGSTEETIKDYVRSPEYGNDFIFTGEVF